MERADVGMVQRCNGASFALELVGELLARNLDRDITAQPQIASAPDLAHAASAKRRKDLVRAEFVACWRHADSSGQCSRSRKTEWQVGEKRQYSIGAAPRGR